jgi:hypothetical protein
MRGECNQAHEKAMPLRSSSVGIGVGIGIAVAIAIAIGICPLAASKPIATAIAIPMPIPRFVAICLYFRSRIANKQLYLNLQANGTSVPEMRLGSTRGDAWNLQVFPAPERAPS